MKSRLLYLNLAIDSQDTSLGFAIGWLKEVSKIYDEIDVITLRKGTVPNLPDNVNIYGLNSHKNKLSKYFYLHKTAKNLINTKCVFSTRYLDQSYFSLSKCKLTKTVFDKLKK